MRFPQSILAMKPQIDTLPFPSSLYSLFALAPRSLILVVEELSLTGMFLLLFVVEFHLLE